jgi:hypothetical protein
MALIYRTEQLKEFWANSGSPEDIQNAVGEASAAGGGTVHVPEGDFAFNPPQVQWGTAVNVPANVKVIGAGIGKTILRQSIMQTTDITTYFFRLTGSNSRISGFSLIPKIPYDNPESVHTVGITVDNAKNFRIDHCSFQDFTDMAIYTENAKGVIDHCTIDNPYHDAFIGWTEWGYGVVVVGDYTTWLPIENYLGKYDELSTVVYIEDCIFSRTRHAVASNGCAWYVIRHCTIKEPRPWHYNMIDVHGDPGGRGLEAYDNVLYGCEYGWDGTKKTPTGQWHSLGVAIRSGGGVIYNNRFIDCGAGGISLASDATVTERRTKNVWIWNNSMETLKGISGPLIADDGGLTKGVDYFLYAKLDYTPYPYPHPLVSGETPPQNVTPWTGTLDEGTYKITMPQQVQVGSDIYNFKQWEDGSTNPVRTISLTSDMTVTATYELQVPVEYTLTVSATTGGTTNPASGSYRYTTGSTVTVTAFPDTNYRFSYWTLNGTRRTENPITITMDKDYTLMAVFEYVPPPVYYTLIISATSGGTTNPAPGRYDYLEGTSVTVAALPDTNYRFSHWELDTTVRTENPITVTMDRDYSLRAVFEYVPPPPLTATIRGVVKDAETTQPIAGAVVTCNGYADVTEIDGSYELVDIPAKSYTLTVTKENYATATAPIDASAGGTFQRDFDLTVTPPTPPAVGILATWGFPICSRFPNAPPCPIILNWAKRKGYIKEGA